MDNVGCYGTEARLTDCAYHRDTSEDSHSGDVWIDCRFISQPDESNAKSDNNNGTNIISDKGKSNDMSRNTDSDSAEVEIKVNMALILALFILSGLIFALFAKFCHIIFLRRKRSQKVR